MDTMSMLQNARVRDMDGDEIGEVFGVSIIGGKMMITIDIIAIEMDDEDGDDPDGGEEIDVDDEEELDPKKETGNTVPLRAVAGGKRG